MFSHQPALVSAGERSPLLEGLPPLTVGAVPLHGVGEPLLEVHLRLVAQLAADLADVHRVAEVVTEPVVLQEFWASPKETLLRAYLDTIDNPQFVLYRIRPTRVRAW